MANITKQEYKELRRLTLKANRRIKSYEKIYREAGKNIIPYEVVGDKDLQTREGWLTKSSPLSSAKSQFKDEQSFREHMRYLRTFDNEALRPTPTAYRKGKQGVTLSALNTVFDDDVPAAVKNKIMKMDLIEITDFWEDYEDRANKLGMNYSSQAVISSMLDEFTKEDMQKDIIGK